MRHSNPSREDNVPPPAPGRPDPPVHRAVTITLMGPFLVLLMTASIPDLSQLQRMAARFAPTELRVETGQLSPGDRRALGKLIEASRVLNDVFLEQVWSGNRALYAKLRQDPSALGKARLHYFW